MCPGVDYRTEVTGVKSVFSINIGSKMGILTSCTVSQVSTEHNTPSCQENALSPAPLTGVA